MKELINVYTYNVPKDISWFLDCDTFKERYGMKYGLLNEKTALLFYVDGKYILPDENDKVKYLGNGEWEIKYEN